MKTQTSHKKILTLTTILLATTIILSLSPSQTKAQNTPIQKGINYLSYGNAWTEPTSILQNDFARFQQDHIQFLSVRVMWSLMMPTLGNVSAVALENLKKVLNIASTYDIKVNLAFWTQFGYNLGFPSWAGTDYYSLIDEPTKTYYLNYLSQTVDQLKNYPAVDSYSILNEPYYTNSSQKIPFQNLMADCVQAIKTVDTTHPVTCRFALSSTPATGRYDKQVYSLFDAFTVTVYLNASNPTDKIYSSKWDDYEKTVKECKELGLPLWVIEFGTKTTDLEAAEAMFEANLAKFGSDGIVRAYAWAWQTRNASNEAFNIYNGTNPKPAYYALTQTTTSNSSTNSSNNTNSTSTQNQNYANQKPTPTKKPTPTPTATPKPQQPQTKPNIYNRSTIHHDTASQQAKPATAALVSTANFQEINILALGIAVVCASIQFRIKKRGFRKLVGFKKES